MGIVNRGFRRFHGEIVNIEDPTRRDAIRTARTFAQGGSKNVLKKYLFLHTFAQNVRTFASFCSTFVHFCPTFHGNLRKWFENLRVCARILTHLRINLCFLAQKLARLI